MGDRTTPTFETWEQTFRQLMQEGLTGTEQDSVFLYAPTLYPSITYGTQRREVTDTARTITLCTNPVVLQRVHELWAAAYNHEQIDDHLTEIVFTEIAANRHLNAETALALSSCPFPGVHRALQNNPTVPSRIRTLATIQRSSC